jgi:hypothetical protein
LAAGGPLAIKKWQLGEVEPARAIIEEAGYPVHRMAPLARRAHYFHDWIQEPVHGSHQLVPVDLDRLLAHDRRRGDRHKNDAPLQSSSPLDITAILF